MSVLRIWCGSLWVYKRIRTIGIVCADGACRYLRRHGADFRPMLTIGNLAYNAFARVEREAEFFGFAPCCLVAAMSSVVRFGLAGHLFALVNVELSLSCRGETASAEVVDVVLVVLSVCGFYGSDSGHVTDVLHLPK